MAEITTYSGVNKKGEPFLQIQLDGKAIKSMTPYEAVNYAFNVMSAAITSVADATMYQFTFAATKSEEDAKAIVHNMRRARQEYFAKKGELSIADAVQSIIATKERAPAEPTDATDVEAPAEEAPAEAPAPEVKKTPRLLVAARLMDNIGTDDLEIRIDQMKAQKAEVIQIHEEKMVCDPARARISKEGRYYMTITQRGAEGTVVEAHNRGSEVLCFNLV